MLIMALSEWRRLSAEETKQAVPVTLTVEGVPTFCVDHIDKTITLSDMHPRVQIQLKAQERKARQGMPPAKKIEASDIKTVTEFRENQKIASEG